MRKTIQRTAEQVQVTEHHEYCMIYEPCTMLCKCACYHTLDGYSTNLPKKGACCTKAKKSFDRKFEWACSEHGDT